jgi:mannose-6-phosphate isomerase-like protein (cupin superfamily)
MCLPWRKPGYEQRDTGIAVATDGLAGVRVVRAQASRSDDFPAHRGEFLFIFILEGEASVTSAAFAPHSLAQGDSCTIPAGERYTFAAATGTEFLEVSLPATLP